MNAAQQLIVQQALAILEERAMYHTDVLTSPQLTKDFLRLRIGQLEHEEFWVVWLDAQHRVIAFEQMFRGTLTQTSVYPREIVKSALKHNAAACIFAHNHPSGNGEPSSADQALTKVLKQALELVDVRTLDHFVVPAYGQPVSFAERGLI
jgi:DNA repair protein RadC